VLFAYFHLRYFFLTPASLGLTSNNFVAGDRISSYNIEQKEGNAILWTSVITQRTITDTTFKVLRLEEKTSYQFRVRANNKAGHGAYSEASEAVTCQEQVGAPGKPKASADRKSVTLEWDAPENTGGAKITSKF